MRLQLLAGALALARPSIAFSDSSPLFLLSGSKFPDAPAPDRFQTSSRAIENAKNILSECPTDRYLIVAHPGVKSFDLVNRGGDCAGSSMRNLCHLVENSPLEGKYVVTEVIGEMTKDGLASFVKKACTQKNKDVTVEEVTLPPVTSDWAGSLEAGELALAKAYNEIASSEPYTILYIGTPGEQVYEPEFDNRARMDLKRDLRSFTRDDKNSTVDRRPLFEKYQFFTPGIFMAIIIALVLLSILGVGLKALSSLEVSYGAFDKDMGPAAQKKQQ
ncbi:BIG/ATPase V1 complex, subunit S1 [Thelonectria olida]|uniref:Protein BIG1 n=1 Tax=Thelonectria olida TaxID=1576542 RepID=A0A9P9ATX8_9HYPO|nr:BIG/ATPase V1 complex, subunit S1 [Thelonectria olida]